MRKPTPLLALLGALTATLSACSEEPGEISRDSAPFAAIEQDAAITMIGTEPFWTLEIEPDGDGHGALYSTPENIEGERIAVTRFAGNNGLGFSGEIGGEALQAAITPGACSDGMSDRSYPYVATVAIGETVLRGCGYTASQPYTGDPAP